MKTFLSILTAALLAVATFSCVTHAHAESQFSSQAVKSYKVRVKVSGARKGSFSPASVQTVRSGGTVSYTVTPQQKYLIESLTVNGAPKTNLPRQKGKAYSFTINKISENKTITVAFATTRSKKALSIGSQVSVVDAK